MSIHIMCGVSCAHPLEGTTAGFRPVTSVAFCPVLDGATKKGFSYLVVKNLEHEKLTFYGLNLICAINDSDSYVCD